MTGKVKDADWFRIEREGGGIGYVFSPLVIEKAAYVEDADPEPEPEAKELALWKSVKDSQDQAMIEAYLTQFPDGIFAPVARQMIEQVNEKAAQDREQPADPPSRDSEAAGEYFALVDSKVHEEPASTSDTVEIIDEGTMIAVRGRVTGTNWLVLDRAHGLSGYVLADTLGKLRAPDALATNAAGTTQIRPASGVGIISKINTAWGFVVINVTPGSRLAPGSTVYIYEDNGEVVALSIERVHGDDVSAVPTNRSISAVELGMEVFAE